GGGGHRARGGGPGLGERPPPGAGLGAGGECRGVGHGPRLARSATRTHRVGSLPMTDRRLPGPRGGASLAAARRLLDDPAPELDALAARYGPVVGLGIRPLRIAVVGG